MLVRVALVVIMATVVVVVVVLLRPKPLRLRLAQVIPLLLVMVVALATVAEIPVLERKLLRLWAVALELGLRAARVARPVTVSQSLALSRAAMGVVLWLAAVMTLAVVAVVLQPTPTMAVMVRQVPAVIPVLVAKLAAMVTLVRELGKPETAAMVLMMFLSAMRKMASPLAAAVAGCPKAISVTLATAPMAVW